MIEINGYSIIDSIKQFRNLIFTKLFFSNCKIIRMPIYIRGRNSIEFGENFATGVGCRLETYGNDKWKTKLTFGKNVQINDYCHISAISNVHIGENTLIASKVFISDHNHGNFTSKFDFNIPPTKWVLDNKDVFIGKNCWLGENVIVLPGVKIGNNCVIGAGSVVTKTIEPFSIAVGNPAKVIKTYNKNNLRWQKV